MVEWKTVSEVCECNRGVRVIKKDLSESGLYPVFQNSLKPMGYYCRSNFDANTPFVITAGAAGDVGSCKEAFWAADDCLCLKCSNIVNNKFVLFFLETKQFYFKSQVRMGAIPRLSRKVVESLPIPIPPLSEQNRIVGILDTFTESIENLKKQISERKKQYEHYRDQLLDLEGKPGVEMKAMGEIGSFIRGSGIQKSDFVEKGFPCIHYGQVHTKYGLSATSTISFINEMKAFLKNVRKL